MSSTTDYTEGDLVLVTFKYVVETPSKLVVFKELDTENNRLYCYSLDDRGLTLAKYENGEYDDGQSGFFSTQPYYISNTDLCELQEMDSEKLDSTKKYYYDEIVSRL